MKTSTAKQPKVTTTIRVWVNGQCHEITVDGPAVALKSKGIRSK